MTLEEFKNTLSKNNPPEKLDDLLIALWYDKKDDMSDGNAGWAKSHKITQDINGTDAAWVHAYLHRKEGDSENASYWYSRAGKSLSKKTLEDEWEEIAKSLLSKERN